MLPHVLAACGSTWGRHSLINISVPCVAALSCKSSFCILAKIERFGWRGVPILGPITCDGERLLNILRVKMLITYVVKLLNL